MFRRTPTCTLQGTERSALGSWCLFLRSESPVVVDPLPDLVGPDKAVEGPGLSDPFWVLILTQLAGVLPVPPQVQPGPHVLKALLGEALDLNCVAQGRPEPQLLWSKDGAALPRAGPAGSVHFEAVQISDAGMYRCEATSSAGTDAWELELRVLGECCSLGLGGVSVFPWTRALCPMWGLSAPQLPCVTESPQPSGTTSTSLESPPGPYLLVLLLRGPRVVG